MLILTYDHVYYILYIIYMNLFVNCEIIIVTISKTIYVGTVQVQ